LLGVLATMMESRHVENTDSRNTDQTQHDPRGQTSTLRRAKRNKVMKCATLLVCLEGAIGVGTYVEWFHSGDVTPIDMNLLALGNSSIDGLSARIDVFPNNLSVHMEGHGRPGTAVLISVPENASHPSAERPHLTRLDTREGRLV